MPRPPVRHAVVLSACAASVPKAGDLLRRIVESALPDEFAMTAVLRADDPLAEVCRRRGVAVEACAPDSGALAGALDRAAAGADIAIVHAHSALDHRGAVDFKRRCRGMGFVVATRYESEAIPATRAARALHNRATDVNVFLDRATRDAMTHAAPEGALWLDHPFLLEQPQVGPDADLAMLRHAYSALSQPTREDPVGGRRRDFSHMKLAYVTHFYCNQSDTSAIMGLLARYASYPADVLDRVHFVVVDDGSPIAYEVPDHPLNLTWLKISPDIRWNQPGARNLGAVYAKSDNLLIADLDHEVPEDAMRALVARGPCGKRLYKFYREEPDGGGIRKGHPNIFLLSRGRFLELHGYDEEFCGHYGSDDFRFVKYQRARGTLQTYLPKHIRIRERTDIDRSRSYHSLVRDLSFNTPVDSRKKMEIEYYGHGAGHSRTFLNFTWTILAERWRDAPPPPPADRWWKRLALLRQAMPRWYG